MPNQPRYTSAAGITSEEKNTAKINGAPEYGRKMQTEVDDELKCTKQKRDRERERKITAIHVEKQLGSFNV